MYWPSLEASKQEASCCAATRHIYYLFYFFAQFIFQHQLKAYSCIQVKNTLGFSHSGYLVLCLPLCSAKSTISPDCSLQILNQNIIRLFIFFNCSIFLKRGAKATRIINREAFLPNKISLSILRKNEMKTENCQLSDSAGCSNNFFVNICPVIAFQMMEICDWLSFSSHC